MQSRSSHRTALWRTRMLQTGCQRSRSSAWPSKSEQLQREPLPVQRRSRSSAVDRWRSRSTRQQGTRLKTVWRCSSPDFAGRHLRFCASQWVFRHSGRLPRIDHINTDGFGLDRGNNGSPGPGTRTLFIIGCLPNPRLTALQPVGRVAPSISVLPASSPVEAAPSPFRAAIHNGKVPPRWGAMLAS